VIGAIGAIGATEANSSYLCLELAQRCTQLRSPSLLITFKQKSNFSIYGSSVMKHVKDTHVKLDPRSMIKHYCQQTQSFLLSTSITIKIERSRRG
jgi:hypothetical protein